MITQPSNQHEYTPRKVMKLGDNEIFLILATFDWIAFFKKPKEFVLRFFIHYLKAINVTWSYLFTSVTRLNFGINTSGLLVGCLGFFTAIAFNSVYVWKALASFVALSIPFFPIWYSKEDLFRFVWIDVESKALSIYIAVYSVSFLTRTVLNWIGMGNKKASKRGESILFLTISRIFKYSKINEFPILILETLTVSGIGIFLMQREIDYYFGLFLLITGLNEIYLLLFERSHQIRVRRVIDA